MKIIFLAFLYQTGARRNVGLTNLENADCSQYRGICNMDYRPVCGTDNVTRGNLCSLVTEYCVNNRNLRLKHRGKCVEIPKLPES